jgi:hypothetical protein
MELLNLKTLFSYVVDIFFSMDYSDTRIVTYGLPTPSHSDKSNNDNLTLIMPSLTPRYDRGF